MKAEFLIENVERFLPIISKILPIHSQIPVLANLLIEAQDSGLFISSTNLEIGIRIKIPAKVEETGATTVPGKQFLEALSSFPKDKVSISLEKEKLTLLGRGNKVVFQTISKEEFPTLFEEKGEEIYAFKTDELKQIFAKIIFAVSLDEARPELTGILISQKEESIDFVATDGFRLSLKKIKNKKILEEGDTLILPSKIIAEALSLKDEIIKMYIYKKSNQVIFETEDTILIGRLINGDFPNYERVIPKTNKTRATVDREEFLQKIRLSSVFAREAANIIKIMVLEHEIKILSSAASLGEGEATLEAEIEGEENEIAFNVKFLNDVLKTLSSKNVEMELSSGVEPALFKTTDDPDYVHIIMPVRVQE